MACGLPPERVPPTARSTMPESIRAEPSRGVITMFLLLATSCDVGVATRTDGSGAVDQGGDVGPEDQADAPDGAPAANDCAPLVTEHLPQGEHRAGQSC